VPLLATTSVAFPGTGGKLFTLLRQEPQISITFQASAPFSTVPGHYGDIGYLPSTDLSLYALNLETGHVDWRFTAGGPIIDTPGALEGDVFVVPVLTGLFRLDRQTGATIWNSLHGAHFLAANPKFAYATDRQDRLLILDRVRGTQLASYDTSGFTVPVMNQW